MRSLRVRHLLQCGARPSWVAHKSLRLAARNGYCASCDDACSRPGSKVVGSRFKPEAKATTTPPIPPADHRQLAVEQELFTTSMYSPGSPLFLPNGASIFNKLVSFLRAQYTHFGFQEVITPTIYKKSLWEKSGHWENYAEDMFSVTGRGATGERGGKELQEDEEYGLKPMNCPGHCLLFSSKQRSFRDLPIRYADFSPLHRNEISGALSGLTRVRRFHQDDGHIFCRPSQVGEEITKTLNFVKMVYKTFHLGPYRLALSTRPKDHYIGTTEEWNRAESALREALDKSGQIWTINEGDGAFYGPKIDIILRDSDGKEHQTATIQLDFQLPKRFQLEYQAPAPELEQQGLKTTDPDLLSKSGPVTPVMIHRAVLGSVERFMALLIEHYNGRWPFWLNPRQLIVIAVHDGSELIAYAQRVMFILNHGTMDPDILEDSPRYISQPLITTDLDSTPRSVKKKIFEAKTKHYGVIVVVGQKNMEKDTVTADFSAISNLKGVFEKLPWFAKLFPESGTSSSESTPNSYREVELTPTQLRSVLVCIQDMYL